MSKYIRFFSDKGNAVNKLGRVYQVVTEDAPRLYHPQWNKTGLDVCEADSLEAAMKTFGLTARETSLVETQKRLVERSPLYVRRALRALGKEDAYNALLPGLPSEAKADYEDAVAFAWDDPLIVGLRAGAAQVLGMTEAELRAIFEE